MAHDGHEPQAEGAGASKAVSVLDRRLVVATRSSRRVRADSTRSSQNHSAPSGIAQLRKSVDHTNTPQSEAMNLDDFIFPSSMTSPTVASSSPPEEEEEERGDPTPALAPGIPIKMRAQLQEQSHPQLPPASTPLPPEPRHRNNEFDYVQRRVRKTSIDERRVCV